MYVCMHVCMCIYIKCIKKEEVLKNRKTIRKHESRATGSQLDTNDIEPTPSEILGRRCRFLFLSWDVRKLTSRTGTHYPDEVFCSFPQSA
jgi:hypothetical protein